MSGPRPIAPRWLRPSGAVVACLVLMSLAACGGGDDDFEQAQPPARLQPAVADSMPAPADTAAALVLPVEVEPAAATPQRSEPAPAEARPHATGGNPAAAGLYSLQLGSFRNLDYARELVGRIEDQGYAPVLESVVLGGQTHHRVLLRGLDDRAEAAAIGESLRNSLGITYLIRQGD